VSSVSSIVQDPEVFKAGPRVPKIAAIGTLQWRLFLAIAPMQAFITSTTLVAIAEDTERVIGP